MRKHTVQSKDNADPLVDLPLSPSSDLPVLFIGGRKDPACLPSLINGSKHFVPQLEIEVLEDGHWLLIGDNKHEVTKRLLSWLETIPSVRTAH